MSTSLTHKDLISPTHNWHLTRWACLSFSKDCFIFVLTLGKQGWRRGESTRLQPISLRWSPWARATICRLIELLFGCWFSPLLRRFFNHGRSHFLRKSSLVGLEEGGGEGGVRQGKDKQKRKLCCPSFHTMPGNSWEWNDSFLDVFFKGKDYQNWQVTKKSPEISKNFQKFSEINAY